MIHEKLKRLKQQINYVAYDEKMLDKLESVWQAFYELELEVNKLSKADVIKSVCQYEKDDTTAMNCKHCGKAKWLH